MPFGFITILMKAFSVFFISIVTFLPSVIYKNDGAGDSTPFYAVVDNKPFELRQDQLLRGIVMNKPGSMDGRAPSRTVISAIFNGPVYNLDEGRLFNEALQFEIGYEGSKLGVPNYYAVGMQYKSGNYYMLPEKSKINITALEWETDNKHFRLSADFDCKLRSWGYPDDSKPDVHLVGNLNKLRVTVPSWVNIRN